MTPSRIVGTVSPRLIQYRLEATRRSVGALRVAPSIARKGLPILGWVTVSVLLGSIVGFSAVVLPPIGVFTIPALCGLVLLWVMPDLAWVPTKTVRTLFFLAMVVGLCVPNYYAIAGTGLPWISLRRLATFPLVVAFALVVAGSSGARARIRERTASAKIITISVIGYMVMIALSIFSADSPPAVVANLVDAYLSWFVPFFLLIYVVRDESDIYHILRVIAWCSIFVALAGMVEFALQRRIFVDLMPRFMVDALMQNNPSFQNLVNKPIFRLGHYRASSIFGNALSFGQFGAMVVPFGYFFLLHPDRRGDRVLGTLVVISGLLGVVTCDSRGAWVSLLASTPVFFFLWVLRTARLKRESMAPALVTFGGVICFALLVSAVIFWPRIHDKVIGGPLEQQSTQARWDQWEMAIPHIVANPVTGHGFGLAGYTVNYIPPGAEYPTLDSSIVSGLVEVGVPGFLFFFGGVFAAILLGARQYIFDMSRRGAISGILACAILAFVVNCTVLSEHENHTLYFLFLGSIVALSYFGKTSQRQEQPGSRLPSDLLRMQGPAR